MRIVSWNIQWGRGADGVVALDRIVAALRSIPDVDVICLQEVAQHFPGLPGADVEGGLDEPALLAAAFPGFEPVFGAALDVPGRAGRRARFGNLLLSRLPVGQVFRHLLPGPPDPAWPSMPRVCVEAVIDAPSGPLRVMTTHLEYYSALQRGAQIQALLALQRDVAASAARAAPRDKESNPAFAARPRPAAAVVCGDFNCEPGSAHHAAMCAPAPFAAAGFEDAWRVLHGAAPHPPSVGLHGAEWPDRPYCCDFAFVSGDVAARVRAVDILADTAASDHQPLVLELAD